MSTGGFFFEDTGTGAKPEVDALLTLISEIYSTWSFTSPPLSALTEWCLNTGSSQLCHSFSMGRGWNFCILSYDGSPVMYMQLLRHLYCAGSRVKSFDGVKRS